MASTPKPKVVKVDPAKEPVVDFMADAPKERPYSEAITAEHRDLLKRNGVTVAGGEATPA